MTKPGSAWFDAGTMGAILVAGAGAGITIPVVALRAPAPATAIL